MKETEVVERGVAREPPPGPVVCGRWLHEVSVGVVLSPVTNAAVQATCGQERRWRSAPATKARTSLGQALHIGSRDRKRAPVRRMTLPNPVQRPNSGAHRREADVGAIVGAKPTAPSMSQNSGATAPASWSTLVGRPQAGRRGACLATVLSATGTSRPASVPSASAIRWRVTREGLRAPRSIPPM